ncbi:CDP-alcohol phosphatidyltransferase [Teladorsagia circumcincta]|uniref:CDP-diacylglycerol--inositol 3-phosphatidyltransferase n=1 Tax=Teladorsagia circumcincta TaxID=45464 RepID=A0A2G9UUG0_TELCI|nr:CDP-alcohol phosphatidyltransferase [Teladorsagia circumcincta]
MATRPGNRCRREESREMSECRRQLRAGFRRGWKKNMTEEEPNVYLFYPNLIGYGRIILAILACYTMGDCPFTAMLCYAISAGLDAIDGMVARKYNQSSRFGAMLDQLTDRFDHKSFMISIQMSTIIDIASHWLHLHASVLTNADTHKKSSNPILHLYYTNRSFLGFMCAGNEAFYLILYVRAFWPGPAIFGVYLLSYLAAIAFPIALVKSAISLVHLVTASQTIVKYDTDAILAQRNSIFKKD